MATACFQLVSTHSQSFLWVSTHLLIHTHLTVLQYSVHLAKTSTVHTKSAAISLTVMMFVMLLFLRGVDWAVRLAGIFIFFFFGSTHLLYIYKEQFLVYWIRETWSKQQYPQNYKFGSYVPISCYMLIIHNMYYAWMFLICSFCINRPSISTLLF